MDRKACRLPHGPHKQTVQGVYRHMRRTETSSDGGIGETRKLVGDLQTGRMSSNGYGEMSPIDDLIHWLTKSRQMINAMQQRWQQKGLPLEELYDVDESVSEQEMQRFVEDIRELQSNCSRLNASLEGKDKELRELRMAHLTALEEKVKSQRALEEHLECCKKVPADSKANGAWDEMNSLRKAYEDGQLLSAELESKLCQKDEELRMVTNRLNAAERERTNFIGKIDKAKNECEELQRRLNAANADLEESNHRLNVAEENLQSLEKCCKDAENCCKNLKADLDQKSSEIVDLKNVVRDLQEQAAATRNASEHSEERNEEPEAMLRTIKYDMAYDPNMQTADLRNGEQPMSYGDMELRCKDLETQLQKKDAEMIQLQQKISSTDQESGDAARRLSELEAELESARKQIDRLRSGFEANEENAETRRSYDDAAHRLSQMQATLEQKEVETATLHAEMENLHEQIRFANKRGDDAQWRCGELEAELERANNDIQTFRADLEHNAAMKHRCEELEMTLEQKRTETSTLHSSMEALEDQIRCANKRGDDAQWRCGELEADLGKANHELGNLRSRLNELEQSNSWLDKSYNDTKWRCGELEAMLGNKDGEINHLKGSLENLLNEKNNLLSEVDELNARCKGMENHLGLSENAEELERKMASLMSENERMKIQLDKHYTAARTSPERKTSQVTREEAYDELSSELYKLHQKKYSLEKQMSEVQTELFSYQQNHLKMMEERKGLENELNRVRENAGRLEWFNGELEAHKRNLEQQLNDKNNEIQYLKGEIEKYNSRGDMNCSPAEMAARISYLETELHKTHDNLREASDKAKWYKGEVDYFRQELGNCHGRIRWLESELNRVHGLLNEQKASGGDIEWDKLRAERNSLQEEVNGLRNQLHEEGEKRRWYQGEKEYFCNMSQDLAAKLQTVRLSSDIMAQRPNDKSIAELNRFKEHLEGQLREMTDKAKWYEGEKEYFKNELTTCAQRCNELQRICDQTGHLPGDAFWIQKEPYVDRNRWLLCQWSEVRKNGTRRTLFETSSPHAHQIYLCLSCFNWECALLMHRRNDGTWYLWVDVPAGRHEFRFMQNGQWHTSKDYNCCWNDYGSDNNWMIIE